MCTVRGLALEASFVVTQVVKLF